MRELTENPDQLFLRRDAINHGYADRMLYAALRDKVLVRIRQGAYTTSEIWSAADDAERYRLKGRAVLRSHGKSVALSHSSASVEYRLRTWNIDFSRVHVTCFDRSISRTTHDIVYHSGSLMPDDINQVDDCLVVMPGRAAVETASLTGVETGLVVLDSALDAGFLDLDELARLAASMRRWPHMRKLQISARLARVGSQSVGESRTRFLCWHQHLPEPRLQFEVYDGSGRLIGITDFGWPDRGLLGEFDGRVKYGRLLAPGEDPGDVMFREKQREDLIREVTGCLMVRVIWTDFSRPQTTGARIRSKLDKVRVA